MNKIYPAASLAGGLLFLVGCQSTLPTALSVTVANPQSGSSLSQVIDLPLAQPLPMQQNLRANDNSRIELLDNDGDNLAEAARLQTSLAAGQSKTIRFSHDPRYQLPTLTHAELSTRVGGKWHGSDYIAGYFGFETVESYDTPPQATDHSYNLRYEGPGWENDQIGYRLYLDWRNAIDVFGKKNSAIVLPQVGLDGYESYHHMSDWGQDLLKVGSALGVGALGRLDNGKVMHFQDHRTMHYQLLENGHLSSAFEVDYKDWKVADKVIDVDTRYRINAGDAATTIEVNTSKPVDNLVTGLVKHPNTVQLQQQDQHWGYIARYGKQSLAGDDDELGFALFYQLDQVAGLQQGEHDDLVLFKPSSKTISYQILSAWPQLKGGINNQQDFEKLLNDKLQALEHPLQLQ
ncbi:DUF4861 family protein [Neptunicella sp. SCSIO 80796]|uniref:DUF4861 family protein n=1 Tax=Neptunicella plasticusilytica TaxID=3117012 RepID=UPI003A4E49BD